MRKTRLPIIAVMLMLSVLNFMRIIGHEDVRPVLFVSIWAIGVLSGLLIFHVIQLLKNKNSASQ